MYMVNSTTLKSKKEASMNSFTRQIRIQFASWFRSYFPKNDLISNPYPDNCYVEIWDACQQFYRQDAQCTLNDEIFKLNTGEVEFINQLGLVTQVTIKNSKIDYSHGFLLVCLLKRLKKHNPKIQNIRFFETGTARGFSAVAVSYIANELFEDYQVTTLDVLDHYTKRYWNSIGDSEGRRSRQELLDDYRNLLPKINFFTTRATSFMKKNEPQRFHLAFLDGQHTYRDVRREFNWVAKNQKVGDIILLDDVTSGQFDGICKFARDAKSDSRYQEITIFLYAKRSKGFAAFERVK